MTFCSFQLLWSGTAAGGPQTIRAELRFLTWSDYMDPGLLEEFERRFHVKVTPVYFESVGMRDGMLVETDGKGYDVILASGISLRFYRKRGWLARLGDAEVPNLKYLDRRWFDLFPESQGYTVPFFWGTTGIGYRKDLVGGEIDSWMQLYHPSESLRGRIFMSESGRDVIGMALKALGYSANSTDRKEIEEAETLLLEQKPYVRAYASPSLSQSSVLVTGEIHAAMMFNGDVSVVKKHHPEIAYVLPKEGGNLWVDYLAVGQASRRKQLAYQFIDFLSEPSVAARLARFVRYATPNQAAEALLPSEFLEDSAIYPDSQILERSEVYTHLPPRALRRRNAIFARLLQ
jgi:spermidine/putrescine transport system substrate-binding protein